MANAITTALAEQERRFVSLDKANGKLLDFRQECLFAQQQVYKSRYTLEAAQKNLPSLKSAILNAAAIGISLNPATQHAYLVPRDDRICLDISYRGLVKLATEAGAIVWAKAELVYAGDTFAYKGPSSAPDHTADVFGERGDLVGGYVIAKLPDGDVLVDVMSVAEIHKVRDTSKAYKKGSGPWHDWYHEMCKKTLLKRAYKSWPQTERRIRLDKAIEALNEHEGAAYTLEQQTEYLQLLRSGAAAEFYLFCRELDVPAHQALFNSFEAGAKSADKQRARDLVEAGRQQYDETVVRLRECAERDDQAGYAETINELSPKVRAAVEVELGNAMAPA